MNNKIIIILILAIIITSFSGYLTAQETTNNKVNVYMFGLSTCPYCAQEKEYFKEYLKTNTDVTVYYFELDTVKDDAKLLLAFGDAFNERTTSVPITFISEKSWIGFSDDISNQINAVIDNCKINECKDSMDFLTNKETYEKYITDEQYFEDLSKEKIILPKNNDNLFTRFFAFIKNIFTKK